MAGKELSPTCPHRTRGQVQAGHGTKEFLLRGKEGKLAQREEGTIVIRVRTQSQAGLGRSEPWPSPLLPIPLSPTMFLAYAFHEPCVQRAGFLLPSWPERRWAPSIVPSSVCLEYLTCQSLFWVGGHGSWQRKQDSYSPLHHPG